MVSIALLWPAGDEDVGRGEQPRAESAAAFARRMIVVLPFENLGLPEDEYFAAGMTEALGEKVQEKILSAVPLRRMGRPEEIAKAVAFLASDDAAYITGHILGVNGGMYM